MARNRIGVINQTLQTLITAATFREGLPVAGIVLNDVSPEAHDASAASNADELRARCVAPLLAHSGLGADASRSTSSIGQRLPTASSCPHDLGAYTAGESSSLLTGG